MYFNILTLAPPPAPREIKGMLKYKIRPQMAIASVGPAEVVVGALAAPIKPTQRGQILYFNILTLAPPPAPREIKGMLKYKI